MSHLLKILGFIFLLFTLLSCNGQKNRGQVTLSDDFDKSPPFYCGMPDNIASKDTSAGWKLNGQKILLTGRVYKSDGKSPVSNVILYYYHTDLNGNYSLNKEEKRNMPPNKLGQTHGYIRGWVKTGKNGEYAIYSVRPASYPSRDEPAHIHLSIKEPSLEKHYYVDDFVFDDDKLLTALRREKMENRGGSGVLRIIEKGDLQIGERDIILGLNIGDYFETENNQNLSGRKIGEDIISFTPFHAWGPDKGSKTCPVCKYGWYHGILYFVGENPNWKNTKQWLTFLEQESKKREKYLKTYFIYGNSKGFNSQKRIQELENLGMELNLRHVALTFVPSFSDEQSEIHLNKINPALENTFLLYKRSNIIDKFTNLEPSDENFKIITDRLDDSVNEYFDLPRPEIE